MYFGSTIITFALPFGALLVAAIALFVLFRAKHSDPRLRWSGGSAAASVVTREPGPAPAPSVTRAAPAAASQETGPATETAADETKGKDGEEG